ncbi:MAG: nuclease, partial [gamma proteobacterium symbiont of Ctena orbiculata]
AFVDLHTIVKRSLLASVERYSIKDLEPFFDYQRKQDLGEASMSRRFVEQALEAGEFDEVIAAHCRVVEVYNREDCESAQRLRNWLETIRVKIVGAGTSLPRPIQNDGEASEAISELDQKLQQLRDNLLEGIPADPEDRTQEQHGRFLLAHMMEFHRREDKASWWEYFRLMDLDEGKYLDEKRAITGLQYVKEVQPGRAPVHRYRYPTQDLDARTNDDLKKADGGAYGKVHAVSYADQTLDIKKRMDTAGEHASSLVLYSRVSAKELQQSLIRFGENVLNTGFSGQKPYQAATELLLRTTPSLVNKDGSLQNENETTVDAACRLSATLESQVLAIQGPPGTGKTYTGGHIICALKQQGLKVGVTAVSHKVIVNLLEGAMKEADRQGIDLRAVHRQDGTYDGEWGIERIKDYGTIRSGLDDREIDVVGATAWCWSRQDFEQSVDVLIIDEAGQMSLSNVLAVSPAGRGMVLLGDPQQLEQPLQSSHPEGSEVSALAHLLDGEETIPPNKGLFLGETYRLHPEIARFTSESYYQGRVHSRPGLDNQAILAKESTNSRFIGAGLRFVPVNHQGNQARSLEEVDTIAGIVSELLENGQWQNKEGTVHDLTLQDILIVAPYNAQVGALIEAIPDLKDRIGTVDRFQGQEAPVVIYSMTSSSPGDAPRGMEFLYDPHRFNVATSRALAMCILAGSPMLFEPECKTPHQMRMANALCRYLELADKL